MCVCVRAYVTEVGCSRGGTRLVMHNLHTCTLYCVCVTTSGHNQGEVAVADAVGEQQLKQTQLGSSS